MRSFMKISQVLRISPQSSLTSLRYLTQADVPHTSTPSKRPDVASEPGLGKKADKSATQGDARMTAAGILLPKDSTTDIDSTLHPEKKAERVGYPSRIRETETKPGKEKRAEKQQGLGTMKAWQISRFGDDSGLKLVEDTKVPVLSDPFDLLVEIHAASVNPFDLARSQGYGENLIEKMRDFSKFFPIPKVPDMTSMLTRKEQPFPITLGRDFSGVVVDAGKAVRGFRTGDEVYGVIGPHRQGTFAQFAATSTWCVAKKPKNVSHTEAASLPYVACTAWSTMKLVANLPNRSGNTRVLVLGGSGGIGSFAIQYLKTLGVHVSTVCGSEGLDLVAGLGADDVIDYKTANVESELDQREKYDVIFEASGKNEENLKKHLKGNLKSFFVTLNYPLLKNSDDYGSIAGLLKSGVDFSKEYLKGVANGNHTIWAFFTPNGSFLEEVAALIDQGRIRPVVGKTFPFQELPAALQQVHSGLTNGKVVVQIKTD